MNQNLPSGGGYPDVKMNIPNNDQIMNKIGTGVGGDTGGQTNNLSSLDDFEERMKKLRNGL